MIQFFSNWKTTTSSILGVLIYIASLFGIVPTNYSNMGETIGVLIALVGTGFFASDAKKEDSKKDAKKDQN